MDQYGGGPSNQGPRVTRNLRIDRRTVIDYIENHMESGYGENIEQIINFPGYNGPAKWAPFYEAEARQMAQMQQVDPEMAHVGPRVPHTQRVPKPMDGGWEHLYGSSIKPATAEQQRVPGQATFAGAHDPFGGSHRSGPHRHH